MNYNIINYLLEDTLSAATYYAEAYHPNYVKKNIVPDLANRFGLSNEQVFKILSSSDPTEDKRYMMFLASSWLLKREEDIEIISEQLFKLIDLSKQKTKGSLELLHLLSLNKKKLSDLNEFVNKFKDVDTDKDVYDNFEKVLSEDGIDVYKITKFIKAPGKDKHVLFCDTNWCVAKEDMFDEYEPPYYLFVDSEKKEKIALFHKESSQLKNIDDEPLCGTADYKKIEKTFHKLILKEHITILEGDDFEEIHDDNELNNIVLVFNFNNLKKWRLFVRSKIKNLITHLHADYLFNPEDDYIDEIDDIIMFYQSVDNKIDELAFDLTISKGEYSITINKNKKNIFEDHVDSDFTNIKSFNKNLEKAANALKLALEENT